MGFVGGLSLRFVIERGMKPRLQVENFLGFVGEGLSFALLLSEA
ncbi:hypothetical protein PALB_11540 [Pseudoalteromonas luteoviolacea B = ATCC 29581]|nr:hypothetical protein PALB_11540 [Pseudoalteromonas luteoviolacea B = ATCC 29581]